ncbi:hypothetical protein CPB83DRAFT_907750 [Crepidotus variabilis]|uniref:Uncharacterized protein n=1 Tax=Crepidotus variabilis TaxID=179855 RepID=A0A9P6EE08_9AGAR|nr:hypothetical protein CPB83DRAFT_907750 [Crepidotus variabilis]
MHSLSKNRVRALRGVILITAIVLCLLFLVSGISKSSVLLYPVQHRPLSDEKCLNRITAEDIHAGGRVEEWDSSRVLKGIRTKRFKDNLKNDVNFITSWTDGSLTNQFIGYVNMIYLGTLSNRISIIPPFVPERPNDIAFSVTAIPFGYVFNISRAQGAMRQPIVEWMEVKNLVDAMSTAVQPASAREPLGCWSTQPASGVNALHPVVNNLGLDVGYTRLPLDIFVQDGHAEEAVLQFGRTVGYIDPVHPIRQPSSFALMQPSFLGHRLTPDEQLTCIDNLHLATSSGNLDEWDFAWAPAWRFVGQYLHFMHNDIELAKSYLSRTFQVQASNLPAFIAVAVPKTSSLPNLHKQVALVQANLKLEKNLENAKVLVISTVEDAQFWENVRDFGWSRLDHFKEMTLEKYGHWARDVLDGVVASMAVGFIGEQHSAFAIVSARRVQEWNGGVVNLI